MPRDRARLVELLASVNPTPAGDHLAGLCHEAAAMLAGETEGVAFPAGTEVEKLGGDYTFAGPVVGVARKLSGAVRYVVEDDRGALHIFRGEQLRRPPAGDATSRPCQGEGQAGDAGQGGAMGKGGLGSPALDFDAAARAIGQMAAADQAEARGWSKAAAEIRAGDARTLTVDGATLGARTAICLFVAAGLDVGRALDACGLAARVRS